MFNKIKTEKFSGRAPEKVLEIESSDQYEKENTGTAWTHNEEFDNDGYLVVKDLWPTEELYYPLPTMRGQIHYYNNDENNFRHHEVEEQVKGSLARYSHPYYKKSHNGIRKKLEKILGRRLYNTYYYDRYYFPGQELTKHADRDACEISVSVHISTNLPDNIKDWPFYIKTCSGEERSCILNSGDGLIYKGCERPHWRNPMPGKKKGLINRKEYYYHQIFFHYVLQDGQRAYCAWDRAH